MAVERKTEDQRNLLVEMPPTLKVGQFELVPWPVNEEESQIGIPVVIYETVLAKENQPNHNFVCIWSGGNFPFFSLFPSGNEFGQEINSYHGSCRGSKLVISSQTETDKRDVQVLLADLPLLSNSDGFGHVWKLWDLRDYWKPEIEEVTSGHIFENPQGLAFIPIPPVREQEGSGGILVTESDLLRDPQVQETLKNFLRNREFKIK